MNTIKKIKSWKHLDYAILTLIIFFIIVVNASWIYLNTRPPHWDMARHLWTSMVYKDLFNSWSIKGLIFHYMYYPPLLYWTTIPFYLIFGTSILSAFSVNAIYISILAFSTYGIGRYLYSRKIGLLATVLALAAPMMVSQFKEYQLDAPLAAMVALCLFLLLKTDRFKRYKWSVLFGLSCGLGLLLKWTFVAFLIIPSAYLVFIKIINLIKKKHNIFSFNTWKNEFSAFGIFLIVALPWYMRNLKRLKLDFAQNGIKQALIEKDPVTFPENLIWQINNIINSQLYLVIFLLLMIGIIISLTKKEYIKRNSLLILTLFSSFAIFTFLPNKDARYLLPLTPIIAILSVFWIHYLKGLVKTICSVLVIIYSIILFWSVSFGFKAFSDQTLLTISNQFYIIHAQQGYIIGAPQKEEWFQEYIFEYISEKNGSRLSYSGLDTMWFNNWGLTYYSSVYGVKLITSQDLDEGDFLLIRNQNFEEVENSINILELKEKVQQVEKYILPDSTVLVLYRVQ